MTVAAVGQPVKTGGGVCVAFKASQFHRPVTMAVDAALERAYASPELHIGSRWWQVGDPARVTRETPWRYWPVCDFDDADDPARALRECYEFVLAELEPMGLEQGRDYALAVSGTKGAKVFFRWLSPPGADSPRIWHLYLKGLEARWTTLDAQVAYHATHRGPWSRHPKRRDRYQAVLERPPSGLVTQPAACLARAESSERPSFGLWRAALPKLGDPSPAFTALWNRAQERWLQAELAARPRRTRPSYARRQTDVVAILDANGIGFREGCGMNGEPYWRLSRCIFCGGRYKAAIKSRSLFYDCFRQRCAAGGGLPVHEWIKALEVPEGARGRASGVYTRTLALRPRSAVPRLPLVRARHELFEAISRVVDSRQGTTLVRCTPGLGKTHATLAVVSDRLTHAEERPKTVIGCPTKELARELAERAGEFELPLTTKRVIVEGRHAGNCSFPGAVAAIGRLGWSPGQAFCAACPDRSTCRYYRTLADAADDHSLVFATHEGATALLESGMVEADLVIFDEDPYRSIHATHRIQLSEIRKAVAYDIRAIEIAGRFLGVAMTLATLHAPETGKTVLEGEALLQLLGEAWSELAVGSTSEWCDLLVAAVGFMEEVEPQNGSLAGASSSRMKRLLTRHFFDLMLELIRDHERSRAGRGWNPTTGLEVDSDGLVTWIAQVRRRPTSFQPHLILDAYGDALLYEKLLGVPIDEINVEADLGRSSWRYVPVRTSREALSVENGPAWKELDRVMEELGKAGGKILVGTYLEHAERISKRYGCDVYHFGRGRGIDSYKGHRHCVLFGVPTPPPEAVVSRARFLFQDDEAPLDEAADPDNRRLWRDSRVQRACDSMREAEAAQLAHRVRPVAAPRNIVTMGMVDYPTLPVPQPFPRRKHDVHLEAMETWVRAWFDEHGWWTPALIGEGLSPVPPIPSRRAGPLWRKIFGDRGQSLSPHRTLSARRVWGDREAAREWVREVARAQGVEHWREL